jgi:hypothetical protein
MAQVGYRLRPTISGLNPLALKPVVDISCHLTFIGSISLLDDRLQIIATTGNSLQFIICEVAPFLSDPSFEMLPVSFNPIPIHHQTSLMSFNA